MAWLRRIVAWYIFPRSPVRTTLVQFVLRHPLGLAVRFYERRLRYAITGTRLKYHDSMSRDHLGRVARHNLGSLWRINRARTERLMHVLPSVGGLDRATASVLVIGPRNEAELLLLASYGFPLRNMRAIDLFSTSPKISLMDMHDLEFGDDQFDLVYASFVFAYSDDLERACAEVARVVRGGGFVAAAFVVPVEDVPNVAGLRALRGRCASLHAAFGSALEGVLWQEERLTPDGWACSTVFRLRADGGTRPS